MDPNKIVDQCIDTRAERWDEGIKGIFVYNDPENLSMALQIIIDVLLSSRPGEVEYEEDHLIPIFFSNPDLLWKTQYPFGRFGGAIRLALEALYVARLQSLGVNQSSVARRLEQWIQYGKPEVTQFGYAQQQLQGLAEATGGGKIARYYMIGDNPHSDMQGCTNMNAYLREEASARPPEEASETLGAVSWLGVLVRTGVYSDGDDINLAAAVVDDVYDAVEWVMGDWMRMSRVCPAAFASAP